jgi:iron complex outermembrane receptor protein
LAAEYETTVAGRYELTGRVDYIHKSRIDYDYANSSLVAQQPYGLLNARLAFSIRDTGLSVGAFATNLTNVHYSIGGYDDGPTGGLGTVLRQMAPPREWGADVEYRF